MTPTHPRFAPALLDELTGGGPVVILAPHPDDESLGCGGLVAACRASGIRVHVVCMTDGAASHPNSVLWCGERLAARRRAELIHALACLGCAADDVTFLNHPDGQLRATETRAVCETITALCDRLNARSLLATSSVDHHADHKATAAIAIKIVQSRARLRLWFYPVWSRWDDPAFAEAHSPATPRSFDTRAWAVAKARAIDAHQSQLGRLVEDDPEGFAMSQDFVAFFAAEPEVYFEVTSCQ